MRTPFGTVLRARVNRISAMQEDPRFKQIGQVIFLCLLIIRRSFTRIEKLQLQNYLYKHIQSSFLHFTIRDYLCKLVIFIFAYVPNLFLMSDSTVNEHLKKKQSKKMS